MTSNSRPSRRQFLQTSAAIAGGLAIPYFVPRRAFGANDRIVTAHVGLGGQGRSDLGGFLGAGVSVAALCDVDEKNLAKGVAAVEKAKQKCDTTGDYRTLLDRKDIDAIVIATPDHWHALPTIHACEAGKDVYCEKPLTLVIPEGRAMVNAARKYERIVQTGSQQRSSNNFRLGCELVRSGRIGKLEKILVGIPGPNHPGEPVADSDPPAELDYDTWLGPAPYKPYNAKRVHYNFRFFRDYSGGQLTNWGAHHIDIAQWGLGTDDSGPVEIEGKGTYHPMGWHEVTETCLVTMRYANGVEMTVGQKQKEIPVGTTFIGSAGTIFVNRGVLKSTPEEIITTPIGENDVHLYESKSHIKNFLECIATRKLPICDVEIGHRSATCCHLVNLACDLKRKLAWDPVKEQFVGDDEANQHLTRTQRTQWGQAAKTTG